MSNASVAVVISYLSISNERYRIRIHDPMESRNSTPNGRVEKHFNLREVTVLKRNSQFKAPLFPVLPMLISFWTLGHKRRRHVQLQLSLMLERSAKKL